MALKLVPQVRAGAVKGLIQSIKATVYKAKQKDSRADGLWIGLEADQASALLRSHFESWVCALSDYWSRVNT